MRPSGIVERQIPADRRAGIADRGISSQIDLFVFDRAPQALNKHIVPPGARRDAKRMLLDALHITRFMEVPSFLGEQSGPQATNFRSNAVRQLQRSAITNKKAPVQSSCYPTLAVWYRRARFQP